MNKIQPHRKSHARYNGVTGGEDAGIAQAKSAHAALKDRQEQVMVKREIESTDGQIDRLVYELPQGG
jgi:hypothetical protein